MPTGGLYIIAGMTVQWLMPPEEYGVHPVGPAPGREQPLKGVSGGRLRNNLSLHGHVRRLSSESADLFASALGPVR